MVTSPVIVRRAVVARLVAACVLFTGIVPTARGAAFDILVPNYAGSTIHRFDGATYAPVTGPAWTPHAIATPWGLTVDESTRKIYVGRWTTGVAGEDAEIYRLNENGTLDTTFNPGGTPGHVTLADGAVNSDNPYNMTIGPDGNLYAIGTTGSNAIYRVNTSTAAVTAFASGPAVPFLTDLAFGPDGHVYGSANSAGTIVKYDGTTGASMGTVVPFEADGAGVEQPFGLDFDASGVLHVLDRDTYGPPTPTAVFRVRHYTGTGPTMTYIPGDWVATPGTGTQYSTKIGPDGLVYVTNYTTNEVYKFDALGNPTTIVDLPGGSGFNYLGFLPIPEPATLSLPLLGGFLLLRRRRQG